MGISRNQFLTLRALAARPSEVSGIELADLIGVLARSSVYAALSALQRDGLIDARWDHSQSHPRRMVRINNAGRAALTAETRVEQALRRRQAEPTP